MPVLHPPPHEVADLVRQTRAHQPNRVRTLAAAALGPLVAGYLGVAALLALVASLAPRSQFSALGVLLATGPAWLAAYHVPLRVQGAPLGMLPLLPTFVLVLLVARSAAGVAQRLGLTEPRHAKQVVFTISGTHATCAAMIASLMTRGPVLVTPAVAFFGVGAVSGLAATAGVARRCGLLDTALERLQDASLHGLRVGALGMAALVGLGAAAMAVGLAASWGSTEGLFHQVAPDAGGGFGLLLLCLAYLPNAVIAALSFLAGPGFVMGQLSVGPLVMGGGRAPAIPLLAAVPESTSRWWALVVFGPALVGALVGWCCRGVDDDPMVRLRAVGIAAAVVAGGSLLLAALASGRLGNGGFDPFTVPAGLFATAMFCWIALPGAVLAWFGGVRAAATPSQGGVSGADPADGPEFLTDELFVDGGDAEELVTEEPVTEEPVTEEPVTEDGGHQLDAEAVLEAVNLDDLDAELAELEAEFGRVEVAEVDEVDEVAAGSEDAADEAGDQSGEAGEADHQ